MSALDPRDEPAERADTERGDDFLAEQKADRLADFTPLTLGERHAECLERIDANLDRAEELCAELDARIAKLLPTAREDGWL